MLRLKRTYDPAARADGRRILVERLWPRGMKKSALQADAWLKEVAPSTELRRWFAHRVERWDEFRRRYRKELDAKPDAWGPILGASSRGTVTLLYSAHDVLHNGAVVLRDYREGRTRPSFEEPLHLPRIDTHPRGRVQIVARRAPRRASSRPRDDNANTSRAASFEPTSTVVGCLPVSIQYHGAMDQR